MNTYRVIFPATDFPDEDAVDFEADEIFVEKSGTIRLWKTNDCNDETVAVLPPGTVVIRIKKNVNPIQ